MLAAIAASPTSAAAPFAMLAMMLGVLFTSGLRLHVGAFLLNAFGRCLR
jgi:hypothetical protein